MTLFSSFSLQIVGEKRRRRRRRNVRRVCAFGGKKAGFVVKIISVTIFLLRTKRERTKKKSIINLSCGEIYSAPQLWH